MTGTNQAGSAPEDEPIPEGSARSVYISDGFRAGRPLVSEGATGVRSFAEELRDRGIATGTIKPPHDLRRR